MVSFLADSFENLLLAIFIKYVLNQKSRIDCNIYWGSKFNKAEKPVFISHVGKTNCTEPGQLNVPIQLRNYLQPTYLVTYFESEMLSGYFHDEKITVSKNSTNRGQYSIQCIEKNEVTLLASEAIITLL